ncbi:MAG: hypothetical protein ACRDRH_25895 [Pseudonocardia sp.]
MWIGLFRQPRDLKKLIYLAHKYLPRSNSSPVNQAEHESAVAARLAAGGQIIGAAPQKFFRGLDRRGHRVEVQGSGGRKVPSV